MVPAAAMGLDVAQVARRDAARWCAPAAPMCRRPTIRASCSGRILGVLGKSGRDKVTIVASPGIADFGAWLEQLLAESTGKQGKGLDSGRRRAARGRASLWPGSPVRLSAARRPKPDPEQDEAVAALEQAGHPVVRIAITDRYHIGQEFFRWEIATAVAGAILGINPFDQPDVEASKVKTRELTDAYEKSGEAAARSGALRGGRPDALCRREELRGARGKRRYAREISRSAFRPAPGRRLLRAPGLCRTQQAPSRHAAGHPRS